MMDINHRSLQICEGLMARRSMGLHTQITTAGATIIDFGVEVAAGLTAGVKLAEIALAGLANVSLVGDATDAEGPAIQVYTDFPLLACLGSQYAGWHLSVDGYEALCSGPLRVNCDDDEIVSKFGLHVPEEYIVGLIESERTPSEEVIAHIARRCGVESYGVTLCIAPATCLAGVVQIMARSIETALLKMFHAKADLHRIRAAWGHAPLAPVTKDEPRAQQLVNDTLLCGSHVVLWTDLPESEIKQLGPKLTSSSNDKPPRPFSEILKDAGGDIRKVDPMMFGPALLTIHQTHTGRRYSFGRLHREALAERWGQ